jgi:hypothetical protein
MGLSAVTGEWHFRRHRGDPTILIDDSMFLTREPQASGDAPETRNDLRVVGTTHADYEAGALENWVDGALKLDGQRFAAQPKVEARSQRHNLDMNTNNFLIQTYVRVDAQTRNGTITGKLTPGTGYALRVLNGRLSLLLRSGGRSAEATGPRINDGKWHHIVAEVDRKASALRLYVDGKLATQNTSILPANASFSNEADFIAGKGIVGAIDFLRVSRGSLADAETTINELYAWEFNGPHLKDFAGRAPARGQRRTVGALEPATR